MTRWHKDTQAPVLFLTTNIRRRVPLFRLHPRLGTIVLESLDYCRNKYGLKVYAYVVMPDHIHLLIGQSRPVHAADFLRDWKGFTGHSIVKTLRKQRLDALLQRFAVRGNHRKDSAYQIFQADAHVEGVSSRRFFAQKLDYIHNNPVEEGLSATPVEYDYSSARNYFLGDDSLFRIDRPEW